MTFPQVTVEQWRAQVEKELAGASFEKTLVTKTPEGLAIAPLYTERPGDEPVGVEPNGALFRVCVEVGADAGDAAAEIAGGADALWLLEGTRADALSGVDLRGAWLVVDSGETEPGELQTFGPRVKDGVLVVGGDPFAGVAAGHIAPPVLQNARASLANAARIADAEYPSAHVATVSTLPYHDAGADAAEELAIALSTGAAHLRALLGAGLAPEAAARQVTFRVAVGRDTFGELCKLRALRIVWRKVLVASGAAAAERTWVHAVCSARTLAQRDPWVNMLRVTTQVFAAALGGADLVTPLPFDEALGAPSALGRRVARNTGLVLREESALGRVRDPAGGAYYFDNLTDALAREAWTRFRALEREGGVEAAITSGRLRAKLETSWRERRDAIAKRRVAVLGVSEFANLDEKLPAKPPASEAPAPTTPIALHLHRDAETFEALRLRADDAAPKPEAVLVTLGPLAESRPRAGFASNFFGAGGIRVRETTKDEPAAIACLCGSDERYATEAVERARALKAAGARRVLLAGRPGTLEPALREAGVDEFLFVGCDTVALLSELLDASR